VRLRIFGPPGTGKTHALTQTFGHLIGRLDAGDFLDEYGIELPHGKYSPRETVLMSFTNSAVDELLSRVGLARGYKTGNFGTMHGIALHLLREARLIPARVVSRTLQKPGAAGWWKAKFAHKYGIPYDPNEELTVLLGNQFFNAYTRAVNVYFPRYLSLQRVVDKLKAEDEQFGDLAEAWLKFKAQEKIIDFDDILALALIGEVYPGRPVLVADEFQDFSPLQWEVFKNWMVDTEYVIVAGDDDQTIFSFQGASPNFLLHEFDADKSVVLKRSFRLPSRVLAHSQLLVRLFIRNRYPKTFEPRKEGGGVFVRNITFVQLPRAVYKLAMGGATVMVLARTNAQVRTIEEEFLRQRVPYYRFKTRRMQVWKDFVDRIEAFINDLKAGKVSKAEARFYLRLTGLEGETLNRVVDALAENPRNLVAVKILRDPVSPIKLPILAEMLGSQANAEVAIRALEARLSGKMKKPAGKIYIDTIHAAKGREADVVVIYDSITNRIREELEEGSRDDFEAEVRVWYVALTRAREFVFLIRGDQPFLAPKLAQARLLAQRLMEVKK